MMWRWAAIGFIAVTLTASSPVVHADPTDPTDPRAGSPCTASVDGAMTWLPGDKAPLVCADGQWQTVTTPYPSSDRWLSHGPTLTLHGGARQNPALEPGRWTATPLSPDSRCRAEQVSVTYGRVDGPPRVDEGDPGRPLSLEVIERLLTIDMSGDCIWQRMAD
jgi:hypothetical protein